MRVAALHIFPVKSMAGFSPPAARVNSWGFAGDRRWMVVDPDGTFLTQRDYPALALLRPEAAGAALRLTAPDLGTLETEATGEPMQVRVWNDTVLAATCPAAADAFISDALGTPCRLVYLDDVSRRPVAARWRQGVETVAFTDGFPVLLTSHASLADLNERLAEPIRINRFRGNIVVEGAPAWAEDGWRLIRIGAVTFRVVKPCDRCLITTIEQETATRPDKSEPLRTLATFRKAGQGVYFGQNLIPATEGEIAAGDPIEVLEHGPSNLSPS